jgi:hypothetical protein
MSLVTSSPTQLNAGEARIVFDSKPPVRFDKPMPANARAKRNVHSTVSEAARIIVSLH